MLAPVRSALLLIPRYDPAAEAHFAAVRSAGGGQIGKSYKKYSSDLIKGLRAAGLWTTTKIDHLNLFAHDNPTAALIDLKGLRLGTSTATFTRGQGVAGNGSTTFANTTFNPSTMGAAWTQNSAHLGVYNRTARTDNAAVQNAGCFNGTTLGASVLPRYISQSGGFINNAQGELAASPANASGIWIFSRTSSVQCDLYRAGSIATAGTGVDTSVGIPNLAIYVGGRNNAGSLDGATTDQHGALFAGGGLTAAEALTYNNLIQAYMTAVGA